VPGALKNAIDVGSRPKGQSAWEGKPCAIVSVAPGAIGAFGANLLDAFAAWIDRNAAKA